MEFGDLLIRSSVRLAMVCYAAVLIGSVVGRHAPATTPGSRWLWTIGCAFFLGHVISAFAFYHHWSHAHAFDDVASQTRQAIGWEFGYGIYVNHLFTLVWTLDVLWSWLAATSYAARPRSIVLLVHGFMLFIVINGLVVFKSGIVRWISVVVLMGITALWAVLVSSRMSRTSLSHSSDTAIRP